jgi:hypothetical protein
MTSRVDRMEALYRSRLQQRKEELQATKDEVAERKARLQRNIDEIREFFEANKPFFDDRGIAIRPSKQDTVFEIYKTREIATVIATEDGALFKAPPRNAPDMVKSLDDLEERIVLAIADNEPV